MSQNNTNKGITLIGMPATGKSTIGKALAKRLDWPLVDIDRWMERHESGMPLAEIIETKGVEHVLNLETKCIRENDWHETIVSTPGSIIYNDVYDVLAKQTHIIWLDTPVEIIAERLESNTEHKRLILGLEEKGWDGILKERMPLYQKWSQYTVECSDKSIKQIVNEIAEIVGR